MVGQPHQPVWPRRPIGHTLSQADDTPSFGQANEFHAAAEAVDVPTAARDGPDGANTGTPTTPSKHGAITPRAETPRRNIFDRLYATGLNREKRSGFMTPPHATPRPPETKSPGRAGGGRTLVPRLLTTRRDEP